LKVCKISAAFIFEAALAVEGCPVLGTVEVSSLTKIFFILSKLLLILYIVRLNDSCLCDVVLAACFWLALESLSMEGLWGTIACLELLLFVVDLWKPEELSKFYEDFAYYRVVF
jgi:hypothetical protein